MNFKRYLHIFLFCSLLPLSGCTHLFFQPSKAHYPFVYLEQIPYTRVSFSSTDQTELSGWLFRARDVCQSQKYRTHCTKNRAHALITQFHGNGENMMSHYRSVVWLTLHGFDVFVFDYRDYGSSQGSANLPGALEDSFAALNWSLAYAKSNSLALIPYGQSLGGSLLLRILADRESNSDLSAIVIEGSFSSYRRIAREKLSGPWLTWPFQWLAYLLINDRWSPERAPLDRFTPTPVLYVYSENDPIVPIHHGEILFGHTSQPKKFWRIPEAGHVNAAYADKGNYRKQLVGFFDESIANSRGSEAKRSLSH